MLGQVRNGIYINVADFRLLTNETSDKRNLNETFDKNTYCILAGFEIQC